MSATAPINLRLVTGALAGIAFRQAAPAAVSGQQGWRCCRQCSGLVYAESADAGACPAGGKHATAGSAGYAVQMGTAGPGLQDSWRWCCKCQGMTYSRTASVCPAGGAHDLGRSGAYVLNLGSVGQGQQQGWRWCQKCSAMALVEGSTPSRCPAGGTHDHSMSGPYAVTLTALPVAPVVARKPQLFLVETYQLSSFRGGLLRGELVKTLDSLQPGQEMTDTVRTKTRDETEQKEASTVLDAQSAEASSSFNDQIKRSADSKFAGEHYDYGMQANFHAEGSISFGSASADAHADVASSTNDVRSEMANSVASALDTQCGKANQMRRDSTHLAETNSKSDKEVVTEHTVHVSNKTDRPQTFGVFQLKQEHVSILSLVDVELAFQDTVSAEDRRVPLSKMDELLSEVIAAPEQRSVVKGQIRDTLSKVRDYKDQAQSIIRDDAVRPGSFIVNKQLQSNYELRNADGTVRKTLSVPGVIIRGWTRQLYKPGATVQVQLM